MAVGVNHDSFDTRLREALRRRLYPVGSLHLKEIATGIGRAENTVTRWWRGETRIGGEDLDRIGRYLKRRGDDSFIVEVFGDAWGSIEAETDPSLAKIVKTFMTQLDRHRRERQVARYWFTAEGGMAAATPNHAAYVRRVLDISERAGDLTSYGMRVLGWIAITDDGDGTVTVEHHAHHIAPEAAENACDWLERGPAGRAIQRVVHIAGKKIDAGLGTASAAAAAIAKAALINRTPRQPWRVKPLPLETVNDPLLTSLLKVHRQEPAKLVHAAAALGAFATSSLFHVSGENVFSQHVATAFGFDARAIVGQNILSRADTDYALMVRDRVLRTRRDGAAYHELTGTIENYRCRYLNLALAEPGPDGRVLTSTVVIEARAA